MKPVVSMLTIARKIQNATEPIPGPEVRLAAEIMRYAIDAPKGEPVPITKSEIDLVVSLFSCTRGKISDGDKLKFRTAVIDGRVEVAGHRVVVI